MRRVIPVTLTVEEVKKLIDQPNKNVTTGLRNKAILSFVFDSGARVLDVTNLRPGDLIISKREAIIKNGKGGIDRNVTYSEYTAELLRKYKEARPKGKYFFCTLEGKKLDRVYLYSMIRRYAKRIGINKRIGLHTIRHSFALNFYKSTHDLIALQKILGHRNINTTQIYCYMDNTDVKEASTLYFTKRDTAKDPSINIKSRIKEIEKEIQLLKANI